MVSCTVLTSFIQYVHSILAVIKFEHSNEYPTHGFKLPGKYLIPIFALLVSCYMVTNFTAKTLLVGTVIAILAAAAYFFIKKDRSYEEKHVKWLDDLRLKDEKEGLLDNQKK